MTNKKTALSGQIWKAKTEVLAIQHKIIKEDQNRRYVIEKGELVEFRFWSPAHVRTYDNLYLRIEETEFYEKFDFYGDIYEIVVFNNRNTFKQILECKLYTVKDTQ